MACRLFRSGGILLRISSSVTWKARPVRRNVIPLRRNSRKSRYVGTLPARASSATERKIRTYRVNFAGSPIFGQRAALRGPKKPVGARSGRVNRAQTVPAPDTEKHRRARTRCDLRHTGAAATFNKQWDVAGGPCPYDGAPPTLASAPESCADVRAPSMPGAPWCERPSTSNVRACDLRTILSNANLALGRGSRRALRGSQGMRPNEALRCRHNRNPKKATRPSSRRSRQPLNEGWHERAAALLRCSGGPGTSESPGAHRRRTRPGDLRLARSGAARIQHSRRIRVHGRAREVLQGGACDRCAPG
jgi:hypothetical protein